MTVLLGSCERLFFYEVGGIAIESEVPLNESDIQAIQQCMNIAPSLVYTLTGMDTASRVTVVGVIDESYGEYRISRQMPCTTIEGLEPRLAHEITHFYQDFNGLEYDEQEARLVKDSYWTWVMLKGGD